MLSSLAVANNVDEVEARQPGDLTPVNTFLIGGLVGHIGRLRVPIIYNIGTRHLLASRGNTIYNIGATREGICTGTIILTANNFSTSGSLVTGCHPSLGTCEAAGRTKTANSKVGLTRRIKTRIVRVSLIRIRPAIRRSANRTCLVNRTIHKRNTILVSKGNGEFIGRLSAHHVISSTVATLGRGDTCLIFSSRIGGHIGTISFCRGRNLIIRTEALRRLTGGLGIGRGGLGRALRG